jgi:hypothetical protein
MPPMKLKSNLSFVIIFGLLLIVAFGQIALSGTNVWTRFPNETVMQNVSISALAQHPKDPRIFYAAVGGVGVFRSNDGGRTWTVGSGASVLGYDDHLYADPQDLNVAYLISQFGDSFKTVDGGATWSALTVRALDMAIDPRDTKTLLVCYDASSGGITNSGILKSKDGGATWRLTAGSAQSDPQFVALAQDPQQPDVLYAWAKGSGVFGIYKSTDAGETWVRFSRGPINQIHELSGIVVDPRDSNTLYLYDFNAGIFKSEDGGSNWTAMRFPIATYLNGISGLMLSPVNTAALVSFNSELFAQSDDGGGHWNPLVDGLRGGINCILVDARDSRTVYAGTSVGLQSLTFTDKVPTRIKIGYPKAGDSWEAGTTQFVYWNATADIWDVKVEISIDDGATYSMFAAPSANWGVAGAFVPNTPSSKVRLRVTDPVSGVFDVSSAPIAIVAPSPQPVLTFDSPSAGALASGTVAVKASLTGQSGAYFLECYLDNRLIGGRSQVPLDFEFNSITFRNGTRRLRVLAYADRPSYRLIGEWGVNITLNNPGVESLPIQVLPSSARAAGLGGSFYTTDLTVTNPGAADAHFTLKFLSHDSDGASGPEKAFLVAAGNTLTFYDVLRSVFGLDSAYGPVQLSSNNDDLKVTGQTWTPGAGGTFGQSVPGTHQAVFKFFGSVSGTINGIREDTSFRTNLILANRSSAATEVAASLHDTLGKLLASKTYSLPPLGMTQVTRVVRDLGVGSDIAGASLRLSFPSQNGSLFAYASVIDNVTNDPRTLLTQTSSSWFLPSSARVGGLGGSFYTTDVSITNMSILNTHGTLWFLGHDRDGRDSPAYRFALEPGATLNLPDVLHTVFGLDSGFGAIRLTSDNYPALTISGQTSTPGAGGTFGQSVPGAGDYATRSDLVSPLFPRSIAPIRDDAAFRTNLVLLNAFEIPAIVTIRLFASNGNLLGTRDVTLPPLGMTQINRVVRELGVTGDVRDARITLTTTTPSAWVGGYAAVIDNVTNDPRTLLLR